ncbi:hypothetical protein FQZ97_1008720 [compost metagenome]
MGDEHGEGGLADAGRADHRDQAAALDHLGEFHDCFFPTHGAFQGKRKIEQRRRLGLCRGSRHLGDEAVTTPGDTDDVTRAVLATAQRTADVRHLHTDIGVFHHQVRPGDRHQFPACQDLAVALHQGGEDVEGATAQGQLCAVLAQDTGAGGQEEWAEGERVAHGLLSRGRIGNERCLRRWQALPCHSGSSGCL